MKNSFSPCGIRFWMTETESISDVRLSHRQNEGRHDRDRLTLLGCTLVYAGFHAVLCNQQQAGWQRGQP